jgi:hypothetical protein
MKLLFVHQNMPGQYRELLTWLVQQGGHEILFLTQRRELRLPGVTTVTYPPTTSPPKTPMGCRGTGRRPQGPGLAPP